jgi:hypothetical protein
MVAGQLARCCYPGRNIKTVRQNLDKLARAGLIYDFPVTMDRTQRGHKPLLYALAPRGLEVAQNPPGDRKPSIAQERPYRECTAVQGQHIRHNLFAGTWLISFMAAFPTATGNDWWTPRYPQGHIDVPTVPVARAPRRPISIHEIKLEEHYCLTDTPDPVAIAPDLTIALRLPSEQGHVVTDLLVEIDNTAEPGYNAQKFRAYDSLLTGWALAHRRYERLATRPLTLFVCRDEDAMRSLMRRADAEMTGAIGLAGTPQPDRWYYAGRDHILFTYQEPIHYGLPSAWMLPPYPPKVREQLGGGDGYQIFPVSLLAPSLVAKEAMVGWELRGGRAVPARPQASEQ